MKCLIVFCVLLAYVTSIHGGCPSVTCSSQNGQYKRCNLEDSEPVTTMTIEDQLPTSAGCDLGISFGATQNEIWVDNGCSAKFSVCQTSQCPNSRLVTCSSQENKRESCDVLGSSEVLNAWVKILNPESAACEHGTSFGYSEQSIWVDEGCRAKFNVCLL